MLSYLLHPTKIYKQLMRDLGLEQEVTRHKVKKPGIKAYPFPYARYFFSRCPYFARYNIPTGSCLGYLCKFSSSIPITSNNVLSRAVFMDLPVLQRLSKQGQIPRHPRRPSGLGQTGSSTTQTLLQRLGFALGGTKLNDMALWAFLSSIITTIPYVV